MGYSIAMRCRSKALKKKMRAFMKTHYRGWAEIDDNQKHSYSRFSDDLDYDGAKTALGFDYNACEPERDYIFAVCRWMAIKIGRKKKWKALGLVPYYVYDGYESWPILVEDEWKEKVPKKFVWCLYSSTGFKAMENKYKGVPLFEDYEKENRVEEFFKKHMSIYFEIFGGFEKVNELIKNELQRLDDLWNSEKMIR